MDSDLYRCRLESEYSITEGCPDFDGVFANSDCHRLDELGT